MCLEMARKARGVAVRPEAKGCPHSANEIIEVACVNGSRPISVFDDRKSPAPEERTNATPIAWGHVGNLKGHVRLPCQQNLPLARSALHDPQFAPPLVRVLVRPRIIFCYPEASADRKKHALISIRAVMLTLRQLACRSKGEWLQ